MQYIFHGDNNIVSRQEFNQHLDNKQNIEIFRIDSKQIDLDKINNFLNGVSLFGNQKILAISNFFSITKSNLDKLISMINKSDIDVVIWQDKTLTTLQLKNFPKAIVHLSKLDNLIYRCLNTIKPNNIIKFLESYKNIDKSNIFDLLLYLIKNKIRTQLTEKSNFNQQSLQNTYLQLIELDYQNKSGQLTISKEIALERIMINLIKN